MRTTIGCIVAALLALAPTPAQANGPGACICFGKDSGASAPTQRRRATGMRRMAKRAVGTKELGEAHEDKLRAKLRA